MFEHSCTFCLTVEILHSDREKNLTEALKEKRDESPCPKRKPDHRLELTEKGRKQAREAGVRLGEILGPEETVYVYVSPYVRTMQTLFEMGQTFGTDRILGVREEPRMREQDFGNFQDSSMSELKKERAGFGRFFFRFPNGESAADVYDRVTSFRETLRNDINFGRFRCDVLGCKTDDCTVVIVTHGLTLRTFLMRWYKWTTDMFEKVRNPGNAELVVMERGAGGRYSLLNGHTDEAELRKFGFDDAMIKDQQWAKEAPVDEVNKDWQTSHGELFFESFPERLEGARRAAKRADAYFEGSSAK